MPIISSTDNHRKQGGSETNSSSVQLDSLARGRTDPNGGENDAIDFNNKGGASDSGKMSNSPSLESAQETVRLPATFAVKYLGKREARGLWGIKYTRKPVDEMVGLAKVLKPGASLPYLQFKVDVNGVTVSAMPENRAKGPFEVGFFSVDSISYGVQDLIYTRVFSMIVVKGEAALSPASLINGGTGGTEIATPFECYAYVCDSRQSARHLTIALATAFQEFSKSVKNHKMMMSSSNSRIKIDLRPPEEMAAELEDTETEA